MNKNKRVRKYAAAKGVRLWRIAEEIRITDSTFSRKLPTEMPDKDLMAIILLIDEISKEAMQTCGK